MGLFDFAKKMVGDSMNRISGQTDVLEAVCAGAALVAGADGTISDDEVMAAMTAVSANPNLLKAFSQSQIDSTMNTMLNRARSGSVGRIGLRREIQDIARRPEIAEIVLATVIDVAGADGNTSAQEQAVITSVARDLGLDPAKYM